MINLQITKHVVVIIVISHNKETNGNGVSTLEVSNSMDHWIIYSSASSHSVKPISKWPFLIQLSLVLSA